MQYTEAPPPGANKRTTNQGGVKKKDGQENQNKYGPKEMETKLLTEKKINLH